MKLFVVVSRFPYPLEKGDKLRAYHQIKELATRHEIYLVCLTDQKVEESWKTEIETFCKKLYIFKLNTALIYWNTFKQLFSDKPYQVGYFYQRNIHKKINTLIEEIKPDHIYCQLIRTAEYLKNIQHIKKTIDYMDALGKGMLRRAEISSGIKRKLFLIEGKRLCEYENRIFDYFNQHTIISEQDRNFINHTQRNTIEIIENGVSESFFSFENKTEKKYDLVFTGNMNYPPNIACAEFLVKELLPVLTKKNPNTTLLISGANPNQRILQLASEQVTISGWIDDIRLSYSQGKIFAAPLFIGTGLQNKLLEAMAMGIPCVTTNLANNALGAENGKTILIANDAETFAEKIEMLLTDTNNYEKISINARNFVRENFSWSKSVEKLESLFKS